MFTVACNAGNGRGFILVVCCAFWLATPVVSAYPVIQEKKTPIEVDTIISVFEQRARAVRTGPFVWNLHFPTKPMFSRLMGAETSALPAWLGKTPEKVAENTGSNNWHWRTSHRKSFRAWNL